MEPIQINISAGGRGEYYNLTQLTKIVDQLQEEIGGETSGAVVEKTATDVSEVEIQPNKVYVWTEGITSLDVELIQPDSEHADKVCTYTMFFLAIDSVLGFDFSMGIKDYPDNPIGINQDASIMTYAMNKVCVTCVKGVYNISITNYQLRSNE